jgi:PIN domain nuclease of toxin-antitoxin system
VTVAYVVDTQALVWHLVEPKRRGRAAVRAFRAVDEGRARAHVPAICLVEIALKNQKGHLKLGAEQVVASLAGHPGYAILPLDLDQAMRFGAFVGLRDPMDRLILAAAASMGSPLISADEALDGRGVERIWD